MSKNRGKNNFVVTCNFPYSTVPIIALHAIAFSTKLILFSISKVCRGSWLSKTGIRIDSYSASVGVKGTNILAAI